MNLPAKVFLISGTLMACFMLFDLFTRFRKEKYTIKAIAPLIALTVMSAIWWIWS